MGAFNILQASLQCPHCNQTSMVEVEFRFGVLNLDRYRLGDAIKWTGDRESIPKVQPILEEWSGEGYAECPKCQNDFWCSIYVKDNMITCITPDITRRGLKDRREK